MVRRDKGFSDLSMIRIGDDFYLTGTARPQGRLMLWLENKLVDERIS